MLVKDPKNLMPKYMSTDGRPHINMAAFEFVEKIIGTDTVMLETGAGSSTVWFAERVKSIVSFETNKDWYHLVYHLIAEKELKNVDLRFDPTYPTQGPTNIKGPFDLAFIDGRGRVLSLIRIAEHIKPGGYIILDDSQRWEYSYAKPFFKERGWEVRDVIVPEKAMVTAWKRK